MNIEEFTEFFGNGQVEIEKEIPPLLKERTDIILIELEERTLPIGTLQGIPMLCSPFAVVTDTHVLDLGFRKCLSSFCCFHGKA